MLRTIQLEGALGREFGENWRLDISSVAEMCRALDALTKGRFCRFLREYEKDSIGYAIFCDERNVGVEELSGPTNAGVIRIMPTLLGGEKSPWVSIIIGVVLAVVTYGASLYGAAGQAAAASAASAGTGVGFGTLAATAGFNLGVAMVIGGIAQLIAPTPSLASSDSSSNLQSSAFRGVVNSSRQGDPVPVGYGEMIVGSVVVSAGLQNEDAFNNYGTDPGADPLLIGDYESWLAAGNFGSFQDYIDQL